MNKLSSFLEAFFTNRLMNERKASQYTIESYRDTFKLLIRYAEKKLKKRPDQLLVEDLNAHLISDFLMDLEKTRKIIPKTRNLRLAAIRSFFRYISFSIPDKSALIQQVLAIPNKKHIQKLIVSLTSEEIKALLSIPNTNTWVGRRDHLLISLAIDTGLRLSEIINLEWINIHLSKKAGHIQCTGKGRKERSALFTHYTSNLLRNWEKENNKSSDFVFITTRGLKMSSDAIQLLLKKYSKLAEKKCSSLNNKKITPHTLRHTAAMNYLNAGIAISTIAKLLGHESIETTQIYLDANLKIKEEALNKLNSNKNKQKRYKPEDNVIQFLKNL